MRSTSLSLAVSQPSQNSITALIQGAVAWLLNRRSSYILVLSALLISELFILVSIAMGGVFYVDKNNPSCNNSNPGTESQPWCTIQHAVDVSQAGDVVFVKAGNYPENVVFQNSGSANGGYIVFSNHQQDVATLDPGSFTGLNKSYIKLTGFHVKNPLGERSGIKFHGSGGYIEITNNEITGCNNVDSAAVRVGGSMHHFKIDGNHIHHNTTGAQEALRVEQHAHDFEITNNEVDHNTNIGIVVVGWAQYGKPVRGIIRGNVSHENSLTTSWSAGIYIDSAKEIIVEHNISWGNKRGFELGCEPTGDEATGNIIRYNIAYGNFGSGIHIGGYQGGIVHHCEIYHNVFYNNQVEIGFDATPGHDNTIVNNILYNQSGNLISGGGSNYIDYNCYYGGSGPGSHSIQVDPKFVDAESYNFRLKADSPCIDKGMDLGLPYLGLAPDIGVYEYNMFTPPQNLKIVKFY